MTRHNHYQGRNNVIPPVEDWTAQTMYLVEVAYNANNPIHRALFYSGFLDTNGKPGNYNGVIPVIPCGTEYEPTPEIDQIFYLKVIKIIATKDELKEYHSELPPPLKEKTP
jgi:hypothetical protein